MTKYIYGLAMPFDDAYYEYEFITNTFRFERTNKESVSLWKEVVATIDHDYEKILGTTKDNLSIHINDAGVFFRLKAISDIAQDTYQKVRKKEINHCSITYLRKYSTDKEAQKEASELKKIMNWKNKIEVFKYDDVLVSEVCITDNPANKATFCTTNKHDPRLKGVRWNE